MKYFICIIIGVVVLGGVWFFGQQKRAMDVSVAPNIVENEKPAGSRAIINGHMLELEVVRTPEEQNKGLSGKQELADNAGMLFPYQREAIPGFWMPDMNFSIDIIWIDKDKNIVGIENNVSPATFPEIFRPSSPVLYVLEVNATWAKDHGVVVGDKVILDLEE